MGPLDGCALINHGNQEASSSSSLSISELYMSKRFIPFDQLRDALTTTILCPSASTEMIENIMELLCLVSSTSSSLSSASDARTRTRASTNDEATEKYHYIGDRGRVAEIPPNTHSSHIRSAEDGTRIARNPNGITSNLSTSSSAADYIPPKDVLQINRADVRNGKLNIFESTNNDNKKQMDSERTSSAYNGSAASRTQHCSSFPGTTTTSERIVSAAAKSAVQLGVGDIVIAAAAAEAIVHSKSRTSSDVPAMATASSSPRNNAKGMAADAVDEFLNEEIKISFRTWCGIVAFAERYTTNILKENDTRHEVRSS